VILQRPKLGRIVLHLPGAHVGRGDLHEHPIVRRGRARRAPVNLRKHRLKDVVMELRLARRRYSPMDSPAARAALLIWDF
jgi:hypothetical protein